MNFGEVFIGNTCLRALKTPQCDRVFSVTHLLFYEYFRSEHLMRHHICKPLTQTMCTLSVAF